MVIETVIILSSGGVAAGFWFFWHTRYNRQERLIINHHREIPPRYDEISLLGSSPAPPYEENSTPSPQVDPPQY
jgi:hypothetical protein